MQRGDEPNIKTTVINGVRQPDPAIFRDAFEMPARLKNRTRLVIIGAIVIAVIGTATFTLQYATSNVQQAENVQTILSNTPIQNVPQLSGYVGMSADDIRQQLNTQRTPTIDLGSITGNSDQNSLDLVKIPSSMNVTDAVNMYQNGISSLSAEDAVRYLSDSWELSSDSGGSVDLHLHYADFADQTPQQAIQSAVGAQGLANTTFTDSGTDSSGNDFQNGTFEGSDGQTYTWSVAACPLRNVYANDGIPSDACYVGVHVYQ